MEVGAREWKTSAKYSFLVSFMNSTMFYNMVINCVSKVAILYCMRKENANLWMWFIHYEFVNHFVFVVLPQNLHAVSKKSFSYSHSDPQVTTTTKLLLNSSHIFHTHTVCKIVFVILSLCKACTTDIFGVWKFFYW